MIGSWQLQDGDFRQVGALASKLRSSPDQVSRYVYSCLSADTRGAIDDYRHGAWQEDAVRQSLAADFNRLINGPSIFLSSAAPHSP